MGVIYCATNTINGKQYVGKSILSIESRKSSHISQSSKDSRILFHRAIRKYGTEAFEWSILKECDATFDDDDLSLFECYFIRKLKTKVPNGYNLTDGGEGQSGWVPTEEIRQKMRIAHTGLKASDRARANMRKAQAGKTVSEATKIKMRVSGKVKIFTEQHKKNLSVAQKIAQNKVNVVEKHQENSIRMWQAPGHRDRMAAIQSTEEYKKRMSESVTIAHNLPEFKENLSQLAKVRWADPDFKAKAVASIVAGQQKPEVIEARKVQRSSEEYRQNMSKAIKASYENPEIRQRRLDAIRAASLRPEVKQNRHAAAKKGWIKRKQNQENLNDPVK